GDLDATEAGRLYQGFVPRHPGTDHEKVGALQVLGVVAAQASRDPGPLEVGAQLGCIRAVDHPDRSAATSNKGCGRPTAAPVAEDEGLPAVCLDRHYAAGPGCASASASTAATREPVQNHSASGVSRQPETMK